MTKRVKRMCLCLHRVVKVSFTPQWRYHSADACLKMGKKVKVNTRGSCVGRSFGVVSLEIGVTQQPGNTRVKAKWPKLVRQNQHGGKWGGRSGAKLGDGWNMREEIRRSMFDSEENDAGCKWPLYFSPDKLIFWWFLQSMMGAAFNGVKTKDEVTLINEMMSCDYSQVTLWGTCHQPLDIRLSSPFKVKA